MNKPASWIRKSLVALTAFSVTLLATTTQAEANRSIGSLQSAVMSNALVRKAPTAMIPSPPNIDATAYIVMDANSGRILAQKNMDKKLPPASLTKLMTMYVISEALAQGQANLNDNVRISREAWSRGGSRMFLKLGDHIPVRDLIKGIIVASGNDACVAMAEYIAGNESSFAQLMNMTAKRLGMTNTHYVDSTGLPRPNHYSSAKDIAILARHIIQDYPEDYKWYKVKWFTFNGIKQPNRNRLLWRDKNVDGLKTGHTKDAGYCLVTSAKNGSTRLITVVMGAPSDAARSSDSQALLNWGFRFYKTIKIYAGNVNITQARVYLGTKDTINLGLIKPFYVTIPNGQSKGLRAKVKVDERVKAPVSVGQPFGKIEVTLYGKPIASAPLVALEADKKGGAWARFKDRLALIFTGWF